MKLIAAISFLIFCMTVGAQDKNLNQSKWHDSDKLEKSDYKLIKRSKIYCSISNDNDYIFINLMIPDKEVSERILVQGLAIWVNMDGKQIKKMGIRFPVGANNIIKKKNQEAEKANLNTEDLISQANTIELIGFISEQDRHFAAQNSDSFRGYVKYSPDGDLFYRLVMPVTKLPVRNSKNGIGAMPFSLGLEIGYQPEYGIKGKSGSNPDKSSDLFWINGVKLASSK
jgi:hypothetical protein